MFIRVDLMLFVPRDGVERTHEPILLLPFIPTFGLLQPSGTRLTATPVLSDRVPGEPAEGVQRRDLPPAADRAEHGRHGSRGLHLHPGTPAEAQGGPGV